MTLTVAAAAAPAGAAANNGARGSGAAGGAALHLTALAFAKSSVNASTGTARVGLTWTITDAAANATAIGGVVYLGVPGASPGTFGSLTVSVPFSLSGTRSVQASGTAQDSTYTYTFHVPQYAQVSPAAWQVVRLTVHDNAGHKVDLTGAKLSAFHAVLSATEVVDTDSPTYQSLALYENQAPIRPYAYIGSRKPGFMAYQFTVQDYPAGLAAGSLQVTGPGGQTITTNFTYNRSSGQCGLFFGGGGPTDAQCGITVTYPPGTPAGAWSVSQLTLTDDAGNTATFSNLNAVPITVTSDQVMKATHFKASPNPVDNWTPGQYVTVQLSMNVTGANGGVSAVYVDTSGAGSCTQTNTVPTVSGTTVTVPIRVDWTVQVCQITGVALVDGAGDVSLYASEYGAPDPYLLIRQVPDTTPPTATSASLSPASIPSSQTGNQQVTLTIGVSTVLAPVTGDDVYVYNASGTTLLYESGGGTSEYQGTVTDTLPLPFGAPPGTYQIGFTITDAGGLSTTYGPGGDPMPGGPLLLTVTSG
jgi:hypothetical protein